ncbi:MAG: GDP-L-fucose synthase [Sphingomonadales bacterium]|nr:MAG: GDP-L-fucose synthase [Sphingomonadales bacterium]
MNDGETFELAGKRIFVTGHRGLVGRALLRRLERENCEVLTVSRASLDLRDQAAVNAWLQNERPDAAILAAARVGGITANQQQPADFLLDNCVMTTNLVEAARNSRVAKLLFIGSSAAYPRETHQPMRETALLTGPLDPAHEGYALAKLIGIKLCAAMRQQYGVNFISTLPTNLYGPDDRFESDTAHVIPALIHKVHTAMTRGHALQIWGTGNARREFLHVDDFADACIHLLRHYSDPMPINVGTGVDVSIKELTEMLCAIAGFDGDIIHDLSKPDGAPQKLLDVSRLSGLGWRARTPLHLGLAETYRAYRASI